MSYSAQDFLGAFQALLPRGPVWPRDPTSIQAQILGTLMQTWSRLAARDLGLLVDGFPATTVELLPEWESTLGLPDPCAGESPTLQQRQGQVLARFAGLGGASVPYLIAFAAQLGFAITITTFSPAVVGRLRVGQPLRGAAWAFTWQVNEQLAATTFFRVGQSAVGEALQAYGSKVLSCELRRIAPAHTVILFAGAAATN